MATISPTAAINDKWQVTINMWHLHQQGSVMTISSQQMMMQRFAVCCQLQTRPLLQVQHASWRKYHLVEK